MHYPVLKIKKGKEKSLQRFHPWIFSGAVEKTPAAPENSIVLVEDFSGKQLGYGFLDPKSQIVCRVFEFTQETLSLDDAYWKQKLQTAFAFKRSLLSMDATNCYRLVHAEGDYLPGLIVDIYNKVAVVQFRTAGTWHLREVFAQSLRELGHDFVFSKSPAYSGWTQGWMGDEGPERVSVLEHGVSFSVDVIKGQKTGFFLDQRDNRLLLSRYAQNKKVLNCFSYTGGFSLFALKGGAQSVTSVDISKEAIESSKYNAQLNGYEDRHTGIAADCFDFLRKVDPDFDLIVLDPPAFSKDIRSVQQASRGYKDINLSAMRLIKPGGLLFTFSCSQHIGRDLFQKIVFGAAADSGRKVRILHHLGQGPDHPIDIYHPEGDYLKGLALEVI